MILAITPGGAGGILDTNTGVCNFAGYGDVDVKFGTNAGMCTVTLHDLAQALQRQ
jgi:hypothetical protein